jgi:hypothetical protein
MPDFCRIKGVCSSFHGKYYFDKYLSKINLTFLGQRKISVFLPVSSPKYKIYFAGLLK